MLCIPCLGIWPWVFRPSLVPQIIFHSKYGKGKKIWNSPPQKKVFNEVRGFGFASYTQYKIKGRKSGSWVNHTVMAHFPVFKNRQKLLQIMWESPGNPYIVPKVCDDFLHVNSSWARPLDRLCFIMRQNKNDNNRQKTSPFICWKKKPQHILRGNFLTFTEHDTI